MVKEKKAWLKPAEILKEFPLSRSWLKGNMNHLEYITLPSGHRLISRDSMERIFSKKKNPIRSDTTAC